MKRDRYIKHNNSTDPQLLSLFFYDKQVDFFDKRVTLASVLARILFWITDLTQRQVNVKSTALTQNTFYPNFTVVLFDNMPTNC